MSIGRNSLHTLQNRVLECFNRVLAGDSTLVREITANAVQDGPVQHIARAALAEQAAEDRIQAGECMELEVADLRLSLKRKAEEWELELAERRMKLKREAEEWELELTDRRSIEKQKLAIQQQKLELPSTG